MWQRPSSESMPAMANEKWTEPAIMRFTASTTAKGHSPMKYKLPSSLQLTVAILVDMMPRGDETVAPQKFVREIRSLGPGPDGNLFDFEWRDVF